MVGASCRAEEFWVGVMFLSIGAVKRSVSLSTCSRLNRIMGCDFSSPRRIPTHIASTSIVVLGGIPIGRRAVKVTGGLGLIYIATANAGGLSGRCLSSGKVT